MFILREVTKEKLEINTCLAIEYVLVLRETNKEEFIERTKLWDDVFLKNIYGVVCFEAGELLMPLHKGSSYYIMTSDGKTFSNISEKE
jgi:hypothetical protein